jgi:signal transduction histidine kinase
LDRLWPANAGTLVPPDPDEFDRRLRDAKLAALAEFAAGAGHEINNPVATIHGRAQQLLRSESDPARRRALASIASQALRIRDMIGDLMLFGRPPEPEPVWIDLAEVAREVAGPLAERFAEAGVSLTVEAPQPVPVFADPLQIAVALTAVVENALNAASAGGHVRIAADEPDGVPALTVTDDGPGFSNADREHAFDPFYSGRQAGRGLGFGLPKAWRIVTLAGGEIDISSRPGETVARMTFPRP